MFFPVLGLSPSNVCPCVFGLSLSWACPYSWSVFHIYYIYINIHIGANTGFCSGGRGNKSGRRKMYQERICIMYDHYSNTLMFVPVLGLSLSWVCPCPGFVSVLGLSLCLGFVSVFGLSPFWACPCLGFVQCKMYQERICIMYEHYRNTLMLSLFWFVPVLGLSLSWVCPM